MNDKFHPQFGRLMLNDEQHLVVRRRQRVLRIQNRVEPEQLPIGLFLSF